MKEMPLLKEIIFSTDTKYFRYELISKKEFYDLYNREIFNLIDLSIEGLIRNKNHTCFSKSFNTNACFAPEYPDFIGILSEAYKKK